MHIGMSLQRDVSACVVDRMVCLKSLAKPLSFAGAEVGVTVGIHFV